MKLRLFALSALVLAVCATALPRDGNPDPYQLPVMASLDHAKSTVALESNRLAVTLQAPKPGPFSYSVLFDLKQRETIPVVSYSLGRIERFAGKVDLDVWSLAGYSVTNQRAVAGFAVVAPWKVASNATLFLGAAAKAEDRERFSAGVLIGATVALK